MLRWNTEKEQEEEMGSMIGEGEKAGHNGQREGSAGKVSRENIRGRVKVMESNRMRGELVR